MAGVLLGMDTIGRQLGYRRHRFKTVLRQGNWVYIPPHEPQLFADKGIETGNDLNPQLYDMDADIGQRDNIADKNMQSRRIDALLEQIHDTPRRHSPVDVCSI